MSITVAAAKHAAQVLREEFRDSEDGLRQGRALEIVAHQLGYSDWNTAAALLESRGLSGTGAAVPVLRILDQPTAYAFYLDYLGFTLQWEHRFEPEMPLYTRLVRADTVLDLSEHYGDGTPGSAVWIPVRNIQALHRELTEKRNPHSRPGIDRDAPGGPTMTVIDPFSNRLRFCEPR